MGIRNIWTKNELENALGRSITSEYEFFGKIEFNSKDIKEGDIFIALEGGARDPHDFIEDAIAKGARAVIAYKNYNHPKVITVPDGLTALRLLAIYKRKNLNARFVGITGSSGKTSTKSHTAFLLSKFGPTFYNKGSFNNHIGTPLSIASIPRDSKFVVLEIGMNHAGEIRELTKIAEPNIAVVTNIGPAHMQNLGSVENICKAKCEIFEGLTGDKVSVINRDSVFYELQYNIAKNLGIDNIFTFGESSKADCFLESYEFGNNGEPSKANYSFFGKKIKTTNNLYGKHQALNLAASLICLEALGVSPEAAAEYFPQIPSNDGRGVIHSIKIEGAKFKIIDDAYNANPSSLAVSLAAFAQIPGKKIVILADMRELGDKAVELHRDMKDAVINSGAELVVTAGSLMYHLHNAVKGNLRTMHFDSIGTDVFEEILRKVSHDDSTILVKGSNSTKIRDFVAFMLSKEALQDQ
ncbi:MAG: UDP-N-acetylmuramoyl-tripeptide--D-alanyl-D-alanine ligase [Rickettsiaceae bacterium]|nr:UDP-N-acetylmuramoyl-tripeptide--D-alanyl-D-alanine ligase [Rickettsiaceae bacterium]